MVRKAIFGAAMIVALFAAPASAQYGGFSVNPGSIRPGGQANFQGSGCAAGSTVTISIGGTTVGTATAGANGQFNGHFTANLGTGTYQVTATCGSKTQTAPLLVRSADVTNNQGNKGGTLARTGSNLDTMGLVGAALLVAGGGVVLATRKRQTV